MLLTEQNTPKVDRIVNKAARKRFGKNCGRTCFEHGQWWLIRPNGAIYSVVDAEPGIENIGLDFEDIGNITDED